MSKTTDKVIEHVNKRDALIVDIDGTLAKMCDRSPYEYHKAVNDDVHYHIADLVERYNVSHHIILLSGRDEECRDVTIAWLKKNKIYYNDLYMREHKDNRKDSIVKKELYKKYVQADYNVEFVLDDRNQVVEMWREIGLVCLQVAEGNF